MQIIIFFKSFWLEQNINFSILSMLFFNIIFYTIFIFTFKNNFIKYSSILNKILFIIINTIVFTVSSVFIKSVLAQLISILFCTLYLVYILKENLIKYFFYSSLFSILLLNLEVLLLKPLSFILNIDTYSNLINIPIFNLGLFICLLSSYELTSWTIKKININILNSFKKETKYEKFIIYFINYALIFQFLNMLFAFNNPTYLKILLVLWWFLNFYFWISMKDIIRIFTIENNEQKILELELYNKSIAEAYDSTKTFKHDFNNIVQAIGGYIVNEDINGLKTYYNQIFPEIENINFLSKLNPDIINNPAIYSILADKYFLAQKYQISINLDVFMDLNCLNAKIYEITRIIGILLDNAIETCKECNKKTINIIFRQTDYKQIIKIENTYADKEICIDKIFEKGYSTKPNNTGLGLWEVKKILSRNKNLNLFTTKDNNFFMQQLEIY